MRPGESTGHWNEIVRDAHLHSWPTASFMVSKVSPSPDRGSRAIFIEDKPEIMAAAEQHGYRLFWETKSAAHFIRP